MEKLGVLSARTKLLISFGNIMILLWLILHWEIYITGKGILKSQCVIFPFAEEKTLGARFASTPFGVK